ELLERLLQVHFRLAAEEVRDTFRPKEREVLVRDFFGEDRDHVLVIDGVRLPGELPSRVERDRVGLRIASRDEVRPRDRELRLALRNSRLPRVRLHRDPADDPCVRVERLRGALVLTIEARRKLPARRDDSPVDGRHHVADHVRTLRSMHVSAPQERNDVRAASSREARGPQTARGPSLSEESMPLWRPPPYLL